MADLGNRLGEALKGRYDVQRELGQGGAAVVYLAQDLKHHRPVAIKVMKPELAAALGAERFLREIEIAAQLNHPHILSLHDSGEADGLLYFVMPFVEGESLRDRLRRDGQLPVEEAVRITREVGEALSYAHGQGLIHRDIKPENILFQAGHALVSDFGIARAVTEAGGARLTGTGLAVGTIAYMSPEQATGEAELDAQTDVYSLGCVLFEMLTGGSPYGAKTPQAVLVQKVVGPVPSIGTERDDVPPTVEAVVRNALATERRDRFETPAQFAEALVHANTTTAIQEEVERRRGLGFRRTLAWTAIVALVVAAGWWTSTRVGGPAIGRLAVLPFTAVIPNPEQAYWVDGAHGAVIGEMQMAGVGVIARTSVMRYRNMETPVREIVDELDCDAVMETSLYLQGDSVSLDVRLVDGRTEEYLWSRSFGGNVRDVVAIYRAVTRTVADAIGLDLTPQAQSRLAETQQVVPEAYEAYLKGLARLRELTPEGLEAAEQYFRFALEKDPGYALAYAGIAQVAGGRSQQGIIPFAEAHPIVVEATRRAMELDSTLADVHYTLAVTKTWGAWEWEAGEAAFLRAIELNPNEPASRAYFSHYLFIRGRPDEAMAQIEIAMELDPINTLFQGILSMDLMYQHRYDEAVELLEDALVLAPGSPMLLSALRSAYHLSGMKEQALDAWRASYANDTEMLAALERGYRTSGYSGALEELAVAMVVRSRTTYVTPWRVATLLTRAGLHEEAWEWLERAYEEHDPNVPYLTVDPIFDPVRDDPRFQSLIERLDLPG